MELLNLLPKRGPQAFDAFCVALRETKQSHLEELLLRTLSGLQPVVPPVWSPRLCVLRKASLVGRASFRQWGWVGVGGGD